MDINFEVIDKNLQECWEYYKEYVKEFKSEHYSDTTPDDFIDWCENELYECPSCGTVVLKDDQARLYDPYNSDKVCDDCIVNGGYYD